MGSCGIELPLLTDFLDVSDPLRDKKDCEHHLELPGISSRSCVFPAPRSRIAHDLIRIVLGGQTGADLGGLEAAIYCSIPHGGWCPKGRIAEDVRIPDRYPLQEMNSADYRKRTEANVVDSDATVVFTYGEADGGSALTLRLAAKHRRPSLHVDMHSTTWETCVEQVTVWLREKCPSDCVLNMTGSRESKAGGIQRAVEARMIDVISKANGGLFYPIREEG